MRCVSERAARAVVADLAETAPLQVSEIEPLGFSIRASPKALVSTLTGAFGVADLHVDL